MLNLTRMYYGYEGYGSREHMNQWMLNGGIGGVHHMGYNHAYGSDNELSGHVELQYSRFFTPEKRVSLDIKARALVYQTNFDLEYGQVDAAAHKFDTNLGLHVGFTVYLGKKGTTGWNRVMTTVYRDTYREREIKVMKVKEEEALIEREKPIRNGTLTFFVFYPNNYSGRNDAPQISTSSVNAIDYLAGGIFTQKQYADSDKVAARILAGQSLNGLTTIDLPTERADRDFAVNYVPRGYEMLEGTPISLSLDYDTMNEFREKSGYYYAPIFDGMNVWKYRIDDATLGQHLLSSANYQETNSYTFAACDLFCEVASRLAQGAALSDIGFATDSLVKKTFLKPNLVKDVLEVHVIYVDGYGNCNLDITYDEFEKLCNKRDFEVQVREVTVKKLYRSYVDGERQARPRSSLILTVSSLGNLQLAINNGVSGKGMGEKERIPL